MLSSGDLATGDLDMEKITGILNMEKTTGDLDMEKATVDLEMETDMATGETDKKAAYAEAMVLLLGKWRKETEAEAAGRNLLE